MIRNVVLLTGSNQAMKEKGEDDVEALYTSIKTEISIKDEERRNFPTADRRRHDLSLFFFPLA